MNTAARAQAPRNPSSAAVSAPTAPSSIPNTAVPATEEPSYITEFAIGDSIAVLGHTGIKSVIWKIMALRRDSTLYINDERVLADITLGKRVRYIMLSGALWRAFSVNDYLMFKHTASIPDKHERAVFIDSLLNALNLTALKNTRIKLLSEHELFLLNAASSIRTGYGLVIIEADTLDDSAAAQAAVKTLVDYFKPKCALIMSVTSPALARNFTTAAVIKGGKIARASSGDGELTAAYRKAGRKIGKKELAGLNPGLRARLRDLAIKMQEHKIIEKIQIIDG